MTFDFEHLHPNVLQTIAFFCFISSSLGPPQVLQLLLLSHAVHDVLKLEACPKLYADVCFVYFDLTFPRFQVASLSYECLAAELVHRFNVLRRIHLVQFSEQHLRLDLWTAYLMVLDSDGQNETQLAMAGISRFIFEFIRRRLGEEYVKYGRPLVNEVNALALWLACLTTSPREYLTPLCTSKIELTSSAEAFAKETKEGRDELYNLICPFAVASSRVNKLHLS